MSYPIIAYYKDYWIDAGEYYTYINKGGMIIQCEKYSAYWTTGFFDDGESKQLLADAKADKGLHKLLELHGLPTEFQE